MSQILLEKVVLDYPIIESSAYSLKRVILDALRGKRQKTRFVRSLTNIDMELNTHDKVGLYGPNGSGKSSLLRLIAGIYPPSLGRLEVTGSITPLLGLGAGIRPEISAVENIHMLLRLDGVRPTKELVDKIWEFTELEEMYRSLPLKTFSTGMQMRVFFAVATHAKHQILLLDEWLSVTDVGFQQKAEQRMRDLVDSSDILVIASHDLGLLQRLCGRIFYLDHGQVTHIEYPEKI